MALLLEGTGKKTILLAGDFITVYTREDCHEVSFARRGCPSSNRILIDKVGTAKPDTKLIFPKKRHDKMERFLIVGNIAKISGFSYRHVREEACFDVFELF